MLSNYTEVNPFQRGECKHIFSVCVTNANYSFDYNRVISDRTIVGSSGTILSLYAVDLFEIRPVIRSNGIDC